MTGALPDQLAWAVLLALLAAIAVVDLRSQRIPNALNAALLLTGLAVAIILGAPSLGDALVGGALGGMVLLAVATAYRRWRDRDGLGLGDVKFLVAAGTWVGWRGIGPLVFLAATGALLIIGVRRLAGARIDPRAPIALGPYLCVALVAVRALQASGAWLPD